MSDTPTLPELRQWLIGQRHPAEWADYLDGLPWSIIKPGAQIAGASKVHPAVALGVAVLHTGDQRVRGTIRAHLAQHTPDPPHPVAPTPNRATRRAQARGRRTAR
jgi:hypothetical protein